MANKSKRPTRGTSAKQAWAKPPATPPRKSPRRQSTLSFVSLAPTTPLVPMDVASGDEDEDMTQATFASTTTSIRRF
eukprot:CAMPEP_0168229540 /NCGR_PEP_ID=MMETSP0140_2-20121125/15338_1 /TAXON_ID=44445 /ORGANISM="Pseudo-nitzschia australis, Strain 10249 10 AB" /LENGTH=76 /DNA_ID=CAMNT_0008161375 /DNA_START=179 /DNA_END=409 /DNA_ORIENTATION=-